jgi:streptogrisin C
LHIKTTAVCSILITALAWGAASAGAADDRQDGGDEIVAAMERDLGLTRDQAEQQGMLQEQATELDARLQRALGDAYAGGWYDLKSGRLVVNVSDEAALEMAKEAGADARLVKHSLQELSAIKQRLDEAAEAPTAGTDKREDGAATDAADRREADALRDIGVSAWSIDPVSNSVLVTVTADQARSATELLAEFGDAVTIEETLSAPETTANFMDGGDAINGGSCSAGFNLRNPYTGARYLLTAGHCVSGGSTLTGQGGVNFGTVNESWFPTYDDAIVRNQNTPFWIQGPWVDITPSNGGIINTSGSTDALVGTIVCKSGITTKWTCGQITAKNETVTYTGGKTVFGLTRHSACAEPGDSGGANVSLIGSWRAEGVSSGASLIDWGGKKRCIGAIWGWLGFQSVSWYFPIADSLAYYGPKYGVTTW